MPNRGPLVLTADEGHALLAELPERDVGDAEDADEERRYKLLAASRQRVQLAVDAPDGSAIVITVSIDEVDEILDVLPPVPELASLRDKLSSLHQILLGK